MNFKAVATLVAIVLFLVSINMISAETTGSINISTQGNISPTTGLYGDVAPNTCSSNADCFSYKCFIDFDGVSETGKSGWCNQTAINRCYHNGVGYASGTYYCRTNTTYHICDTGGNGTWGSQTSCASSQTCTADSTSASNPCSVPSSSSTSGGSGGGTNATTNVTFKHSIRLVSGITDFDIVQGESSVKYAIFKNDGNLTLSNVTLLLSGLDESWYGINPPKFTSISSNKTNQFNVTFFIPKDAQVKSYTINAEIKTHKSDVNTQFSFVIRVSPSNETVEVNLLPQYSQLVSNLQALEQNITSLISQGIDEGNSTILKNLAETIKSKLNQANQSIEKKEYFSANSLLSEAETLLGELRSLVAETKVQEKQLDIMFISIIAFVIIVILFVLYLLWPQKARTEKE